jgi:general secretion pathway protein G
MLIAIQTRPRVLAGQLRCAYCHAGADRLDERCVRCGTLCHRDCLATAKRCPTLGCVEFRVHLSPRPRLLKTREWLTPLALSFVFVLGVFVTFATWVTATIGSQIQGSDRTRVQADMKVIGNAADLYRQNMGKHIQQLSDLNTRPDGPTKWRGPYLTEWPPRDPWGRAYLFTPNNGFNRELATLGADGKLGGVDENADISLRDFSSESVAVND